MSGGVFSDADGSLWRDLIEHGSLDDLSEAVIARLRFESRDRLVDLEAGDGMAILERLLTIARQRLDALPLDGERRRQVSDLAPVLVELAFERQGELGPAIAAYALIHDRQLSETVASAVYARALVRYRLAVSFVDRQPAERGTLLAGCALGRRATPLLDDLWRRGEIPKDVLSLLMSKIQSWLGGRLVDLGDHHGAEDAYCQAATYAQTPDARVAAISEMCSAIARQGEVQRAYSFLEVARDELDDVRDDSVRSLWEATYHELRIELGGDPEMDELPETEVLANFHELERELLGEGTADPEKVDAIIQFYRAELADTPPEDIAFRHRGLTQLAHWSAVAGDLEEAEELLREAADLEDRLDDDLLVLERQQMSGRLRFQIGDVMGSLRIFADAWPHAARLLGPSQRVVFVGYHLESYIAEEAPKDLRVIGDLAERVLADLETLLELQPGSAARRRVREIAQRPLEAAVSALLRVATQEGESTAVGQDCLRRIWRLLVASRNPELRWVAGEAPSRELRSRLRKLEDRFHGALRDQLLRGRDGEREVWRQPLKEVLEFELARVGVPGKPGESELAPPEEGIAVIFFKIRDLLRTRPLLALRACEGEIAVREIDDGDGKIEEQLAGWAEGQRGSRAFSSREVRHRVREGELRPDQQRPPLAVRDLVPSRDVFLLMRELRPWREPDEERTRDPLAAKPWSVFPDGLFHTLPIEMLPDAAGSLERFGQRRGVRLCLRSTVDPAVNRPVDFARGWLGVGDVPARGAITALPGSRREVVEIRRLLSSRRYPAALLLGAETCAGNLTRKLAALRPAVLHIAAHGYADPDHPDACTLILAHDSERSEGELLPFRRIAELPLAGVELVVLSACSSLLGRSGRSAGMEGLAWAFLQAGVTQVIASRYRVADRATVGLMSALYEGLLTMPVADALGRARDISLTELGLSAREVGAWSVWC